MEYEENEFERLLGEMLQEEEHMQRHAQPARRTAQRIRLTPSPILQDAYAGIPMGTSFNPHTYPYVSMLDRIDVCNAEQPKPNELKVNNVSISYDDLINALPLPGLRVMLNPEKEKNYISKLRSISGTIIDKCGTIDDIQKIIRGMKEKGFTSNSWYVTVKFDELGNHEIRVRDLILIGNTSEVVHEVKVGTGSTMHLNESEYQEKMDEHLIKKGRKLTLHNIWNDEFRRKIFEEA